MKILIDVKGDFDTGEDILDLVDGILTGTSFHVDILWHDEYRDNPSSSLKDKGGDGRYI